VAAEARLDANPRRSTAAVSTASEEGSGVTTRTDTVEVLMGPAVSLSGSEPVECQNDTVPEEKS
jgi:hypothetical protein